jgi:hypothetical protein
MRQVSVLLDAQAPTAGAFAHALDWAFRLSLPLRGVLLEPAAPSTPAGEPLGNLLAACATASRARGVPWNGSHCPGPCHRAVEHLLQTQELCVVGDDQPAPLKQMLFQSERSSSTSLLVCPRSWSPLARVLILHQNADPSNGFLEGALGLCRMLQTPPVLLTAAPSETEAQTRKRRVEKAFAGEWLHADFDFVVGWDLPTAVTRVARWRRCSHAILEQPKPSAWWSWLRGDMMKRWLGVSDALPLLFLSAAGMRAAVASPAAAPRALPEGIRPHFVR